MSWARACLGAIALTLVLTPVSAVPAPAAAPVSAPERGDLLPPHFATSPLGRLSSGSSDYVMANNYVYDEQLRSQFTPVRLSDGTSLPTVAREVMDFDRDRPTIVDDSWLLFVDEGYDSRVERYDVGSGQLTATTAVGSEAGFVHADDEWVLLRSADTLSFVSFDGPQVDLTAAELGAPVADFAWVAGDSEAAYLVTYTRSLRVDPSTGDITVLTDPDGNRFPVIQASPGRLLGLSRVGYTQTVSWLEDPAHNSGYGSVVVTTSSVETYLGMGQDVVAVTDEGDDDSAPYSVRPVDLVTGGLGEPMVERSTSVIGLGDGSIAAVLTDTPTGRIVRLGGAVVAPVGDLPTVTMVPRAIAYSGGRPVVSWARPPRGLEDVSELAAYSGGEWQKLSHPSAEVRRILYFAGGAIVGRVHRGSQESTYRITRRGGLFHDLQARAQPKLSYNGRWVQVPIGAADRYQVQDSRTGKVVASYQDTYGDSRDFRVISRNWLWSKVGPGGNAVARDLTGTGRKLRLHVPFRCDGGPGKLLDVRGRWAVTTCANGDATVHDRRGQYRSRTLAGATAEAVMGDGYLARTVARGLGTDHVSFVVRINALGADHRARSYGLVDQNYLQSVAVDRRGPGAPVYLDVDGGVRSVDLSWLD